MPKKSKEGPYLQIRLTRYAAKRLDDMYQHIVKELELDPHRFPLLAGKDPTYSDVIILMHERMKSDSA
jgi:hypothetical protein